MSKSRLPFDSSVHFNATLRDKIARVIGDRILTGDLPDGARLALDKLAEEFGSSTTPVREALLQLAHDGLVDIVPRRGITVRGMTAEQLQDNFSVFGALAGTAATWAAEREGAALAARLRSIDDAFDPNAPADDMIRANWEFHREINRACGSPRLLGLIRQMSRTVPASYFTAVPDQAAVSSREHGELVEAIEASDLPRVRQLAENHLRDAGVTMVMRARHESGVGQDMRPRGSERASQQGAPKRDLA